MWRWNRNNLVNKGFRFIGLPSESRQKQYKKLSCLSMRGLQPGEALGQHRLISQPGVGLS